MPNEQITVPLFTAGEVLTAANMNISAGTGVPVFLNTTTRDAAFGGAGEKVLAEGQLCYLSSTNVVQYYSGSAWATVGPAASGALTCVKAQTTQTGASRVELDDIFSATYRNYLIIIEVANSANTINLQMNASGTPVTTGTYNRQAANASGAAINADRATAQTSGTISGNGVQIGAIKLWLYAPFIAQPTNYLSEQVNNDGNYQTPIWHNYYGNQSDSTSFTGVDIVSSTTFDSTITCYGFGTTV